LILTHNHSDHNGNANLVLQNIKVKNLVISVYDNSLITKNVNIPKGVNLIKVKRGDELKCGKMSFKILNPDENYLNINDLSIVLYTKIGPLNFLFLGDVSKNIEEKLVNLNLQVDVLKIAHHGSVTSTAKSFIANVKPKYAIIMIGNKKYSFPSIETINTLNEYNVKIYRTDYHYSIYYQVKNNKYQFLTLRQGLS